MTYAHLIAPRFGEEPRQHAARVRDLESILAKAGNPVVTAQHERVSTIGLMSLFGMETTE